MAGFDGSKLQQLEAVYLESRNVKDLVPLYKALLVAGEVLLKDLCLKKGLRFNPDRQEEIIHDACTRLLEMYLKHKAQKSMPLGVRLHLELKYQLFNPNQQKYDKLAPLYDDMTYEIKEKEEEIPISKYLDILKEATDINGKKIVVDLYQYRYYKWAILSIEKYTNRPLIYKYAKVIDKIWCVLHNKRRKT